MAPPDTNPEAGQGVGTIALGDYARETDRLLAFHLALLHGGIAAAQTALQSAGPEGSGATDLTAVRKQLGPTGTRAPRTDEVFISFHDALIAEMMTARQIDNFLTYVVQLLALIFAARPELLRSNEQVRIDFVLSHPDRESLVQALIERRVDRLAYLGLRELDGDLRERLGFSLFTDDTDREEAIKLIELRNVIVHNRGVINRIAASRCAALQPDVGRPVGLTSAALTEHRTFLGRAAQRIDRRAIEKFRLSAPGVVIVEKPSAPPNQPLQPSSGKKTKEE